MLEAFNSPVELSVVLALLLPYLLLFQRTFVFGDFLADCCRFTSTQGVVEFSISGVLDGPCLICTFYLIFSDTSETIHVNQQPQLMR